MRSDEVKPGVRVVCHGCSAHCRRTIERKEGRKVRLKVTTNTQCIGLWWPCELRAVKVKEKTPCHA